MVRRVITASSITTTMPAARHPGLLAQMVRKILVGLYFVARRKLTPKEFLTGFMFGLFGIGGARGDT